MLRNRVELVSRIFRKENARSYVDHAHSLHVTNFRTIADLITPANFFLATRAIKRKRRSARKMETMLIGGQLCCLRHGHYSRTAMKRSRDHLRYVLINGGSFRLPRTTVYFIVPSVDDRREG